MTRKDKAQLTPEQILEYAKLMVEECCTNKQVQDTSGAGSSAVSRCKRQYEEELAGNTYGKRRIQVELTSLGHEIGRYRTASLMKKADVEAIRPMSKHYYPDAGKEQYYALNILKRQFNPNTCNTHLVGDITYIRTWKVGVI